MTRRPEHAVQVGEWIAQRRGELGLNQTQLAARLRSVANLRTVGNVERGATAVVMKNRPAWERVLGWTPGSITEAYLHGTRPVVSVGHPPLPEIHGYRRLLDNAGIPDELAGHEDVLEILRSDLSDAAKAQILGIWHEHRLAFDRKRSRTMKIHRQAQ